MEDFKRCIGEGHVSNMDINSFSALINYLYTIQNELFNLGTQLANPKSEHSESLPMITADSVKKIETEYEYFENFIKRGNWEFIENQTNRETYKIIDSAKLVTGINSTLLFESLGRGNKTIFFNVRPNFFPFNSQSFGYLSNKPDQGPFWYNGTNKKIFQKIADDVINLGEIEWKKIIDHYSNDIMKYDYNNSILKKKL